MSTDVEAQAEKQRRLALLIMENKSGAALGEAVTHLRTAAECWTDAGWPTRRAEVLLDLGRCHLKRENHNDAADVFAEAAGIYDNAGTEGALACEAHLAAGSALRLAGRLEQAEPHLRLGLDLAKKTNDLMRILRVAGAKCELADTLIDLGRTDEGIEACTEALKTFDDYRKSQEKARCHEQLARAYDRMGDATTAAEHFEASANINLELGRRFEATETLSRFADVEAKRGAFDQALALLDRCHEIHEQDHNRSLMAVALRLKGMVYNRQGNGDAAKVSLQRSLDLATAVTDHEGEARARYLMAAIDRKAGRLEPALKQLEHSMAAATECGHLRVQERILAAIARIQRERGDDESSLATMHQWVEILKELGERQEQLRVLGSMAALHQERGAIDEAEQHLRGLIEVCTRDGDQLELFAAHRNLAVLMSKRSNHSEAAEHFRSALLGYRDLWRDDRTPEQNRTLATLHYQYGACLFREEQHQDAIDQYEACLSMGDVDEHLRARALVGLGNAQSALGDDSTAFDLFEEAADLCEEQGDIRATSIIRKATRDRAP